MRILFPPGASRLGGDLWLTGGGEGRGRAPPHRGRARHAHTIHAHAAHTHTRTRGTHAASRLLCSLLTQHQHQRAAGLHRLAV